MVRMVEVPIIISKDVFMDETTFEGCGTGENWDIESGECKSIEQVIQKIRPDLQKAYQKELGCKCLLY